MKKTVLNLEKQDTAIQILSTTAQQQVKGGDDDFIITDDLDGN